MPTRSAHDAPAGLVGDGVAVPCLDGCDRPYLNLDTAASTSALPAAAARVAELLPWYSSVHRGAGYKSQLMTAAYEDAREAILTFAGRSGTDDVAIICRNTTEAINHLAYRLRLQPADVVVTTVVEHHANLLPWARYARRRVRRVRGGRDVRRRCRRSGRSTPARRRGCSPSPAPRTSPAGSRRSTRSSRPRTSEACRSPSTPRSSRRTGRCRPAPTSCRSAATRCTRRSAPER